jgi:hypothetical protein
MTDKEADDEKIRALYKVMKEHHDDQVRRKVALTVVIAAAVTGAVVMIAPPEQRLEVILAALSLPAAVGAFYIGRQLGR